MASDVAHMVGEIARGVLHVFLWNVVLFNLGRLLLLTATLGRYPRDRLLQTHANRISATGVVCVVFAWSAVAAYNHWPRHLA
ncbi:MAG: hypothetical protein ABIR62_09555 [Dokdonella sp.]|uniref:hypothetical protein n=1 Tax=Dokdonella sp. TaxID=2291710 RepID=UPI003267F54D